jgi:hypothetical protein
VYKRARAKVFSEKEKGEHETATKDERIGRAGRKKIRHQTPAKRLGFRV